MGAMDTRCTGRVFIVEDSAPIRSRLVEMLGAVEGLCVVGEAESPTEAVAGITETRPDCVVLDFQLIGGTAVYVARVNRYRRNRVHRPHQPPDAQYRRACMEAGAISFLDKSTEFGKLKAAVAECMPSRH